MKEPSSGAPAPILTFDNSINDKVGAGSEARFVLDQQRLALGVQLVAQMSILVKTARIHHRDNAALGLAVEPIVSLLKTLAVHEPLVLRLQADFLFMGDQHLRMTVQQTVVFLEFVDLMHAYGVGAITFDVGVSARDVLDLAYTLGATDLSRASFAELQSRLHERKVRTVSLEEARSVTVRVGVPNRQAKPLVRHTYVKAAAVLGEAMREVRGGSLPSLKQARRAIHTMIDLMSGDESLLVALTTLRCYDQYTHNHSVNVAILSIALASRVGYSKAALADIGLGALLHDLGKAFIPPEVLNKPGELTDAEWRDMRRHPVEGVLCLARLRGLRNVPHRLAAASFEHHMSFDGTGYPRLRVPWTQTLTSRIITVADFYDAITSARVYRRTPIAAERALNLMVQESGRLFDPVLVKLFVSCVGLIPIGSMLLLDTGEIAIVTRVSQERGQAQRPTVKLLTDPGGRPLDTPVEVSLTEVGDDGRPLRSVSRIIDHLKYGLDPSRYML